MVQEDVDFVVYDAKSGDDITRAVLTQIIVEEESKGQNLLPINFLRQLISFYGDSMQWMVPRYLEHMMEAFSQNQDRMRQSMQETFGGMFPFGNLEEVGKQNMALFDHAKGGEDIPRPVLTQIIVGEESKGQNLLPINFLRQLISFYGDSMQWMVPRYLEHMMEAFSQNQDRMRQSMQETFGGMFPFGNLEEVGKQNMALFENAL